MARLHLFINAFVFYLILLVVCCQQVVFCIRIIPTSFSSQHKTTYLPNNPSLDAVLKVLSNYEVDTHVEVVLVGKVFSQNTASELSSKLEYLSTLSAHGSPFSFVHEKLIYHTSLGNVLDDSLAKLIDRKSNKMNNNFIRKNNVNNNANVSIIIDAADVGKLLADFHFRASTQTTLFVLHSSATTDKSLKDNDDLGGAYSYKSALPYCTQRAFIACNDGFAWIDLTAKATNIQPSIQGMFYHPTLLLNISLFYFSSFV